MSILVETDNSAPQGVTVRVRELVFTAREVRSVDYLRAEFPSQCWNSPNVQTTVTSLLEAFFVAKLPADPRIEHIYWDSGDDVLKVWTVVPEPDFAIERPIYAAQMAFMDTFPSYRCDFYVIYRFGKSADDVRPQGARVVR